MILARPILMVIVVVAMSVGLRDVSAVIVKFPASWLCNQQESSLRQIGDGRLIDGPDPVLPFRDLDEFGLIRCRGGT